MSGLAAAKKNVGGVTASDDGCAVATRACCATTSGAASVARGVRAVAVEGADVATTDARVAGCVDVEISSDVAAAGGSTDDRDAAADVAREPMRASFVVRKLDANAFDGCAIAPADGGAPSANDALPSSTVVVASPVDVLDSE